MTQDIDSTIRRLSFTESSCPAIMNSRIIFTYKQFNRLTSRAAGLFDAMGIKKGSRAALIGRNSVEYIIAMTALWRTGAAVVPLDYRFPPELLISILERYDIPLAVADGSIISSLKEHFSKRVILSWQQFMKSVDETSRYLGNRLSVSIHPDDEASILMTSGSTSGGKAVILSFGNHYYSALGSNENIPIRDRDTWLLSLPLFHVGGIGILFRCFLAGASVMVLGETESISSIIRRYPITHVSFVPAQLQEFIAGLEGENPGNRLKAILLGGSSFPAALVQRAVSLGLPIYTTYGLTEMASQVTTTPADAPTAKILSSGKLLKYRDLKIDENNEICVKGETLFKGYADGKQTIKPFDPEGWFHTGDLGRLDEEGYLFVTGRRDNMFISGGENIIPEEIEDTLTRFPGIRQAVAVPVENERYGFRPVAFIKFGGPGNIEKDSILEHLGAELPGFKIPDVFYDWPEGIDGSSLKVKRPLFLEIVKQPEKLVLLFKKHGSKA